jgi:hypothetical protein
MLQNAINTGNVSNGLWKDAARELAVQKQREELLRQEVCHCKIFNSC